MSASEKTRLIANLVGALKPVPLAIQQRQVEHFRKADPAYGDGGEGTWPRLESRSAQPRS